MHMHMYMYMYMYMYNALYIVHIVYICQGQGTNGKWGIFLVQWMNAKLNQCGSSLKCAGGNCHKCILKVHPDTNSCSCNVILFILSDKHPFSANKKPSSGTSYQNRCWNCWWGGEVTVNGQFFANGGALCDKDRLWCYPLPICCVCLHDEDNLIHNNITLLD